MSGHVTSMDTTYKAIIKVNVAHALYLNNCLIDSITISHVQKSKTIHDRTAVCRANSSMVSINIAKDFNKDTLLLHGAKHYKNSGN